MKMQLNITISLQTSQGLRICQSIMLKMPELGYLNSRKVINRMNLTACFKARGSLLTIESWSWGVQRLIGMTRVLWIDLKCGNEFATLLQFFATCSPSCTPPTSLFLVCKCSLCILECIRVTILYQISSNYEYWFMIWSLCKIFLNQANPIFLCPYEPCTIWSGLQLCIGPSHAQNLET